VDSPAPVLKPDMTKPYMWVATWFGCGLMRPAPGTWGTIGALPFAILLKVAGGWPLLLAALVLVTLAGYWAAGQYEKDSNTHDSGIIVIDEVAGVWLTLLFVPLTPLTILAGFLLFRFFDILKPWPVSWCDKKVGGALGVMADDIAAGIYAAIVLGILNHYVF